MINGSMNSRSNEHDISSTEKNKKESIRYKNVEMKANKLAKIEQESPLNFKYLDSYFKSGKTLSVTDRVNQNNHSQTKLLFHHKLSTFDDSHSMNTI